MSYALSIENLSKCYNLYEKPIDRFLQGLWKNRKKYYKEHWAVKDLSLQLEQGEILGIIGRNGSGKSTVLQMLCNVLAPTSGNIKVNGKIAALLELGAGFNPEFTGRENIRYNALLLGLTEEQIEERMQTIVDFADIGDYIDQPVKTYSSGMYVRVGFAVATHVDADILVIDEALSVGDAAFQFKCLSRLEEHIQSGKTVIFVSHDMGAIKNYCTKILYLHEGKTKYYGPCEEGVELYLVDNRASLQKESKHKIINKVPINSENGYAFGSKSADIVSCQMGIGDGESFIFKSGDRVWLKVIVRLNQEVPNLKLVFAIRDIKGYNLFAYDNCMAGISLEANSDNVVECKFSFDCNLQTGKYSITVRVEDSKADGVGLLLDKQINAAIFEVLQDEKSFNGTVNLRGSVEV